MHNESWFPAVDDVIEKSNRPLRSANHLSSKMSEISTFYLSTPVPASAPIGYSSGAGHQLCLRRGQISGVVIFSNRSWHGSRAYPVAPGVRFSNALGDPGRVSKMVRGSNMGRCLQ